MRVKFHRGTCLRTGYAKGVKDFDNVWASSDFHFNHSNILKYCNRPFLAEIDKKAWEANGKSWHRGDWKGEGSSKWKISRESVEMMDETIINNTNRLVQENDALFFGGDWAFAHKDYYKTCKLYRDRINCKNIYFIWGNHDHYEIADLFTACYDALEFSVNDQYINFFHYSGAVWDKSHRNAWQLYGHSHSGLEPWIDKAMPGHRSIDVGIDNAYKLFGEFRPFSFNDLSKIMDKREGFFADHHGSKRGMVTGPTEEEINA